MTIKFNDPNRVVLSDAAYDELRKKIHLALLRDPEYKAIDERIMNPQDFTELFFVREHPILLTANLTGIPEVIKGLFRYYSETYKTTGKYPDVFITTPPHYHEIEYAAKSMMVGNSIVRIDIDSDDLFIFNMRITTMERERR